MNSYLLNLNQTLPLGSYANRLSLFIQVALRWRRLFNSWLFFINLYFGQRIFHLLLVRQLVEFHLERHPFLAVVDTVGKAAFREDIALRLVGVVAVCTGKVAYDFIDPLWHCLAHIRRIEDGHEADRPQNSEKHHHIQRI